MTLGARFVKWDLGLFIFGVFLSFGPIGHYVVGAIHPTGEAFLHNISLWFACPWTMAVAVIQFGGLGMVVLGLTRLQTARLSTSPAGSENSLALLLCFVGLLGIFAVGYAGYSSSMPFGQASTTCRSQRERTRGCYRKRFLSPSTWPAPS